MKQRHAFTLIELIVAISVIAILIGMLVVGLKYVGASSREKATRITLENLQSMLSELENTGGLNRLSRDFDGDGLPEGAIDAPGSVVDGQADRTGPVVQLTRDAMAVILAIPQNQSALSQLPPEQLFTFPGGRNQNTPVVLDAWNNPIIFVFPPDMSTSSGNNLLDRYGLRGLSIAGQSGQWRMLNPDGIDDEDNLQKYPNTSTAAQRLPHFRPFWVSAGPDGNFTTHDDNLYSFEN